MTDVDKMIDELAAVIKPFGEQHADKAAIEASVILSRYCAETGWQKPKKEIGTHAAAEKWFGGERAAISSWEAGPPDWGIQAAQVLSNRCGRLVETYYGFDLMFYERK